MTKKRTYEATPTREDVLRIAADTGASVRLVSRVLLEDHEPRHAIVGNAIRDAWKKIATRRENEKAAPR